MLYLNLQRLFAQKDISNPIGYLYKNGFTRHTARRLITNESGSISYRNMERLCVVLNCGLNDLFAWQPGGKTVVPPKHPLQSLRRGPMPTPISHDLHRLPPEQLDQVRRFIDNLKQEPEKQ